VESLALLVSFLSNQSSSVFEVKGKTELEILAVN
jgi:hypothetical protein